MNKICFALLLIPTLLISCVRKVGTNDEAQRQQELEKILAPLRAGGKAGSISVKGMITTRTANGENILDERLSLQQIGGKGKDGSIQAEKIANNIDLTNVLAKQEIFEKNIFNTYINFGCTNLTSTDLEGLTEEQYSGDPAVRQSFTAEKIFICNKINMNRSLLISASVVEMRNAELEISSSIVVLIIKTGNLVVSGNNIVEVKSTAGALPIAYSQSIDLIVSDSIKGQGHLTLRTVGADWIAAKAK